MAEEPVNEPEVEAPPAPEAAKDAEPDQQGGFWPEDWRKQIAGEDAKAMKRLERFGSPSELFQSYRAAESKLRSGELTPKLGENPSDEDLAEYRKANGIPEAAEGYFDALKDGLTIGEEDKPIIADFMAKAHEANASPEFVNAALDWYYGEIEQRQSALAELDAEHASASEEALRAELGGEYKPSMNHLNSWLEGAPEGVKDSLLMARGPDGALLKNNPAAMQWLMGIARDVTGTTMVMPGGQSNPKAIEDRLAEIGNYRRTQRDKYYKDEAVLKEERELLAAQEKLASRAA